MNKTIEQAFNDHLNAEFFSAYLYLSMANYLAARNLDGMAHWMRLQVEEERSHAIRFIDYMHERDGRVILQQIDQPKVEWEGPLEIFREAYEHECLITSKINALVDLAIKQNDHATTTFLQWFVTEQVEEEANVSAIVSRLEMIGDHGMGILMMDQQLAQRTITPDPAGN